MPGTRIISEDELSQHNSSESIWMVIHNHVYDVTAFLSEHPGGEEALMDYAGMNATVAFDEVGHSKDAQEMMKKYKIGEIEGANKKCKMCDEVKKYGPYAAGVIAVGLILGFVIMRTYSK